MEIKQEPEEYFDDRVLILKEPKTVPDVVHEYTTKEQKQPLIFDNGSNWARVGFANKKTPQLIFRNLVAKPRKDRNKKETKEEPQNVQPVTQIGNDIINIEAMRFQLRTQFDRNVVTHFYLQEQIFDYVFKHLGINTQGAVNHPILITEAVVNPNYCRSLMSELLFECYQVPAVCYGIDSLFSFSFNESPNGTALIISIGYTTTHVIPFLDGKQIADKIRRINVGGYHMITYMHRLLQLKYPVHVNNITLSRAEEMLQDHCSIAYDYMSLLKSWATNEYYEEHVKKIQLPYSQVVAPPTLSDAEKMVKRKEMSRRLAEINARKREEKLAEDEDTLQRLEDILEAYEEDEDEEDLEMAIKEFSISTSDELEKLISVTRARIEKIKQKMLQAESGVQVEEKQIVIPMPPPDKSIEDWIIEVRVKKNHILDKKQIRKQRRSDLAKRRTAAAQERMRIISKLAGKEKGTDDFGSRDEDWDVYKAISREQDSDSEVENEKLLEYDDILRHHDPLNEIDEPQLKMGIAEYHQLHFSVEAIRATEILFQPSMIGIIEAGIAETIDYVLKLFPADEQQRLVDNIFLAGGPSKIPGLIDRLNKELMEMRPFQSTFAVKIAKDPSLDAWNGARKFATTGNNLQKYQITKEEYSEMGGEYVKEYFASNKYFATPAGEKLEAVNPMN